MVFAPDSVQIQRGAKAGRNHNNKNHCLPTFNERSNKALQQSIANMNSDGEDEMPLLMMNHQRQSAVVVNSAIKRRKIDHRTLPREQRRDFRHREAHNCIMCDHLGPKPLFNGREFEMMFRVSRTRFQCMIEDFGNSDHPFYSGKKDCFGRDSASLEARLLLPLKCLAHGVPPHCFMDYFSMSSTLAKDCCNNSTDMMVELYIKEFLRAPTKADLKSTLRLHKHKHRNIDGMTGSLDCMHTYWDKCPVAWHGAFKNGSKKKASIVLEAVSDYHMWFWHCSCGHAGTLNDINIMNLSPLMEMFLNGEMEKLESEVVPFKIGEEEFKKLYLLVDGIYPVRTRFVKAIKEPISDEEKALTSWQEAARKDIERAFGLLQSQWKVLSRAILLRSLTRIESLVTCCLILHNMLVSDRVMDGRCRARHDPASNLVLRNEEALDVQDGADCNEVLSTTRATTSCGTGGRCSDEEVIQLICRRTRFQELMDKEESARLHTSLMEELGRQHKKHKASKQKAAQQQRF